MKWLREQFRTGGIFSTPFAIFYFGVSPAVLVLVLLGGLWLTN